MGDVLSFSAGDVFADAKVMLYASLIMMLLVKARNDVMFSHFAAGRNFTHEVNFTIADNFTGPKGQT